MIKDMNEVSYLRHINLSNNSIVDISVLANFKDLVTLKLNNNKVKNLNIFANAEEECFPKLRVLEVSGCKISEIPALQCP